MPILHTPPPEKHSLPAKNIRIVHLTGTLSPARSSIFARRGALPEGFVCEVNCAAFNLNVYCHLGTLRGCDCGWRISWASSSHRPTACPKWGLTWSSCAKRKETTLAVSFDGTERVAPGKTQCDFWSRKLRGSACVYILCVQELGALLP